MSGKPETFRDLRYHTLSLPQRLVEYMMAEGQGNLSVGARRLLLRGLFLHFPKEEALEILRKITLSYKIKEVLHEIGESD